MDSNEIKPDAVYSKPMLAALLGVSVKTIERMSGISTEAMREKALKGTGSCGDLPAPFYLRRQPYWLGKAILQHFTRKQEMVLRGIGA